jgi:nucleotide-binding universal stress UspA family protein
MRILWTEYKSYCEKKHIHKSDYQIVWDDNTTQQDSVAKRIMNEASTNSVDFIVVGAIGKGGPGVDQVGHVPKEIVVSSIFPVVVVPPEPVNTIPYKSSTFVLAVDGSRNSLRGLTETFKLMHAGDKLRVIHFYKKPICGSYDTQAFQVYEQAIQDVKVEGIMEIVELENGWTIAESIQKYIAVHRAAYLVVGREGESKENPQNDPIKKEDLTKSLGRITRSLLRSPRCALVLCP